MFIGGVTSGPPGAGTIRLILGVVGSFVDASFCTLPPMSGRCSGECGPRPSIIRLEPVNSAHISLSKATELSAFDNFAAHIFACPMGQRSRPSRTDSRTW